ncbi:hypothetical protein AMECASPLE_027597 [Ameca splendens]|uniref:Protein kinase domain-containing protein n=1 Tax=Ameca splendens TaxID=208324 RepID=A0ABV0YTJ7_9TELE
MYSTVSLGSAEWCKVKNLKKECVVGCEKCIFEKEQSSVMMTYYIFKPTLKGLCYLHFMRKIHREMKAGNILCDREGHAKLAGAGLAEHLTVRFDSTEPSTL